MTTIRFFVRTFVLLSVLAQQCLAENNTFRSETPRFTATIPDGFRAVPSSVLQHPQKVVCSFTNMELSPGHRATGIVLVVERLGGLVGRQNGGLADLHISQIKRQLPPDAHVTVEEMQCLGSRIYVYAASFDTPAGRCFTYSALVPLAGEGVSVQLTASADRHDEIRATTRAFLASIQGDRNSPPSNRTFDLAGLVVVLVAALIVAPIFYVVVIKKKKKTFSQSVTGRKINVWLDDCPPPTTAPRVGRPAELERRRPKPPYVAGRRLALFAMVFLSGMLVVFVLTMVSCYFRICPLKCDSIGIPTDPFEVLDADWQQRLLWILKATGGAATAIPFLLWIYRVYRNLPSLGARFLSFSPGSAVGWWFVPVANLIQPYFAIQEIWNGSDPRRLAGKGTEEASSCRVVVFWWAAHLATGGLQIIADRTAACLSSNRGALIANWLFIVQSGCGIVAVLLAIQMIRRIDANQEKRFLMVQAMEEQSIVQTDDLAMKDDRLPEWLDHG